MTVVNNFAAEVEKFKLNFTQDERNQHDVAGCANRPFVVLRQGWKETASDTSIKF
jgi:hypothetical protein